MNNTGVLMNVSAIKAELNLFKIRKKQWCIHRLRSKPCTSPRHMYIRSKVIPTGFIAHNKRMYNSFLILHKKHVVSVH